MAGEWIETTVGEIASPERNALVGGPFGSNLVSSDYVERGVPVIRGQNMGQRWIGGDFAFVTAEKASSLAANLARPGDIVFTQRGTLGQVALVPESPFERYLISQSQMKLTINRAKADPLFIYYVFQSVEQQDHIRRNAIQTGVPHTNLGFLRDTPVPLPPLLEQHAIARILGTLDDKIELNRRMNETLEAMARAIFKSWFVDFLPVRAKMAAKENDPSLLLPQVEPNTWFVYAIECNDGSLYIGQTEDLRQRWLQHVGGRGGRWTRQHPPVQVPYWERQPSRQAAVEREKWLKTGYGRKWLKREIAARTQTGDPVRAKAEGRDPGLPKHIADLFPDRFEESELGEIPSGWEIRSLYDCAEYINGSAFRNEHFSLNRSGLPVIKIAELKDGVTAQTKLTEATLDTKYRITSGDILFSWSGSPDTSIDTFIWVGPDGWLNQHIFKISFKKPEDKYFVYFLLRHFKPEFIEIARNKQTTGLGHVTGQDLKRLNTAFPSNLVLKVFNLLAEPLFQKVYRNHCESRQLVALRDTLLPKLISGEVRVRDAERNVSNTQVKPSGVRA